MIKSELVLRITERLRRDPARRELYQRDVETVVNAVLEAIAGALARGDRVELRGFGTFTTKRRDARVGRNPRTGTQVAVAEKGVPYFKTGKEMRERLNRAEAPPAAEGAAPAPLRSRA